jgi:hypothetical protein
MPKSERLFRHASERGNERSPDDLWIREVLSRTLTRCQMSRQQVAEAMSRLLERSITVHILNDCTSLKKPHRFPAAWVPAFCEATGDDALQKALLSPRQRALLEAGESAHTVYRELSQIPAPKGR